MLGIIDIGGGLRGVYTAGIYDYLIDNGIEIEYCMGVSSGSGNLINYVSGQRGRAKRFYTEHSFDKNYLGAGSYIKKGMLINLDYIYSTLINSDGKDPLDFDAVKNSSKSFNCVATVAKTGKPCYFTKDDMKQDDYTLLKACCALPVACRKPISFKGEKFFDGGASDPMPYEKAFADGCEKLIICITLPIDHRKTPMPAFLVKLLLAGYPKIRDYVIGMHDVYNNGIESLLELEKQGKAIVIYPRECFDVSTISGEKENMEKLYQLGYEDGKKIEEFVKKYNEEKTAAK